MLIPNLWVPQYVPTQGAGLPSAVIDRLCRLIESCSLSKNGESGFGVRERGHPYIETALFAAGLMKYLSWHGNDALLKRYGDGLKSYVLSFRDSSGGFADEIDGKPLVFATYYSVASLRLLDAVDDGLAATAAAFLRTNASPDGLPHHDGFPPDVTNCFWGVSAAAALGEVPGAIFGQSPLEFVRRCETPDGSYSSYPDRDVVGYLQPTAEATIVRHLYGENTSNVEDSLTRSFLARCEVGPGRFSERPGLCPSPRDSMLGSTAMYLLMGGTPLTKDPSVNVEDLWMAHTSVSAHLAGQGGLGILNGKVRRV